MGVCMGSSSPLLKLGLVTDGVWMCMSVGIALNEHIEVNITDANATTTTTDQNQRRQEAHAQE